MFTTVLPTLLAAAALSTQTVNPSTAATTVAANAPAAETTAITTTAPKKKHEARIPGTFDVTAESDVLAGAQALYVVRTGDGA